MTSLIRTVPLLVVCVMSMVQTSVAELDESPRVKVELRRAEHKAAEGLIEAMVIGTNNMIYMHKKADITNDDIADVRFVELNQKAPAIEITFTKEGAKKVAKLTEQHQDKPLAIVVDGKVISAPIVRMKFSEHAVITGNFSKEDMEKLVKGISGK
jgi:preprotein translocase subunit SecD